MLEIAFLKLTFFPISCVVLGHEKSVYLGAKYFRINLSEIE